MKIKPKNGPLLTFQVRNGTTNELIKMEGGATCKIRTYTAKSARHQAKIMFNDYSKIDVEQV